MTTVVPDRPTEMVGGVVVTGAAKGIGAAIATRLAPQYKRTWCLDVDEALLEKTVVAAGGTGVGMEAVLCDVGDPASIEAAWKHIDNPGVPVTACVCNAGIFPRRAAVDIDAEEWERVLAVNLGGTFRTAQQAARRMIADGRPGSVVAIASGQAFRPLPGGASYAASKAAIVNLVRALATEWGPHGIRINTVVPGVTDTDQPRAVMDDADFEMAAETVPLGRIGTPEDIAASVAFLLSPDAAFVTGETLAVNGGALML